MTCLVMSATIIAGAMEYESESLFITCKRVVSSRSPYAVHEALPLREVSIAEHTK